MKNYVTQNNLKMKNFTDVFAYVYKNGGATRREIEQETEFSWGTVSSIATELINRGYVTEEKSMTKTVGKSASVLKPDKARYVSVGIDVNSTGLMAEVVGLDRSVKWQKSRPFTCSKRAEVIAAVYGIADEAVAFCKDRYQLFSLGAAVQGQVDGEKGIAEHFPKIADWQPFAIGSALRARYGVPAFIGHDPQCMLYAGLFASSDGEIPGDCALIRADDGVGLAVMQGGAVVEGAMKMELGHTTVVADGCLCTCGRRGCLEAYSSIRGIESRAGVPFCEVARSGKYEPLLHDAAKYLGHAMHNVAMLFAPKEIILTGKLAAFGNIYRDAVKVYEELEKAGRAPLVPVKLDATLSAAFGAAVQSVLYAAKTLDI